MLAQAEMASGKADGPPLTIISSPIMLWERSTDIAASPKGGSSYRAIIFFGQNKAPTLQRTLIIYQNTQIWCPIDFVLKATQDSEIEETGVTVPSLLPSCCHLPRYPPCTLCQRTGRHIQLELFMMFPFSLAPTIPCSFYGLPGRQMEYVVSAPPILAISRLNR